MLEHAFYVDQHTAVTLLERIVRDESIHHEIARRQGKEITEARYLLDAPVGAASDHYWPTIPRYTGKTTSRSRSNMDDDVAQRIRNLVRENSCDTDLPHDWEIADLTL
jgi:hypothetical protein